MEGRYWISLNVGPLLRSVFPRPGAGRRSPHRAIGHFVGNFFPPPSLLISRSPWPPFYALIAAVPPRSVRPTPTDKRFTKMWGIKGNLRKRKEGGWKALQGPFKICAAPPLLSSFLPSFFDSVFYFILRVFVRDIFRVSAGG